jgi:hypothetical protein
MRPALICSLVASLLLALAAAAPSTAHPAGSPVPRLPETRPTVMPLTLSQVQKLFPNLRLALYRWPGGEWSFVTPDPSTGGVVAYKGTHTIRVDLGWDARAAYLQKLHSTYTPALHWTFFHDGFAHGGFGRYYNWPQAPNQPVSIDVEFPLRHYWAISIDIYRPASYSLAQLKAIIATLRREGSWR